MFKVGDIVAFIDDDDDTATYRVIKIHNSKTQLTIVDSVTGENFGSYKASLFELAEQEVDFREYID